MSAPSRSGWHGPPLALLVGWAAAVLAGGLRSDTAWLAGAGLFWLLLLWSPPDATALSRMNLWWAWAGWVLLSALASIEPTAAFHAFVQKATVLLFFATAWAWWGPRERAWWLASLFLLAAALGAACLWDKAHGNAAGGLLPPNPNYTACFLAAAASACVWCAADDRRRPKGRLLFGLLAAAYAAAAFLLQSRGALFAIAGACLLWAYFHRSFKFAALGVLAALAVAAAMPRGPLQGFLKLEDPLAYERPRLWKTAIEIADGAPWLGVGPGCYEAGYFLHRRPVTTEWAWFRRYTSHAHCEPLHLAAETGWLGLGFMAWALLFFVPAPRPASKVSHAAAGAFWAVLLHSMVDGVMALPAVELLFFCSMACASDALPPAFRYGPPRWRPLALAGAAVTLASWLPVHRAAAWAQASSGAVATEEKIAALKDALAVHPADSYARDRLAAVYLLEPPSRPALALWQLDEALRWNPSNALFWDQKAELLYHVGDPEAARLAAVRASELEPNFISAQIALGESALAQGRPERLREAVRRIEEIRRRLASVRPASEYERLLIAFPAARFAALKKAAGEP